MRLMIKKRFYLWDHGSSSFSWQYQTCKLNQFFQQSSSTIVALLLSQSLLPPLLPPPPPKCFLISMNNIESSIVWHTFKRHFVMNKNLVLKIEFSNMTKETWTLHRKISQILHHWNYIFYVLFIIDDKMCDKILIKIMKIAMASNGEFCE